MIKRNSLLLIHIIISKCTLWSKKGWINQGIPFSWGCTGNALSNQWSIDNEEITFFTWQGCLLECMAHIKEFNKDKLCQTMINRVLPNHLYAALFAGIKPCPIKQEMEKNNSVSQECPWSFNFFSQSVVLLCK